MRPTLHFAAISRPTSTRWAFSTRMPSTTTLRRENIGLIEVMGLAILPPRLVPELGAVREHLLAAKVDANYDLAGALESDDPCRSHAAWAEDVYARRADELTADNAIDILHEEVGVVFGHVLDNAGVFKWDEAGRAAQQRFIDSL